ncbi:MAG TPA: heterodisulfide reductase-related iron-sulfur binding cluster [Bacteriovoracaceae bacterium]|nr:heterodisulfide reductase-related iron-sulfur binding cluster [Bacteriovoracaceae bacterium]
MDATMEASRQIMWMIPFWMKVTMYLSLGVATYFFVQGLLEKYRFVTNGKDWKQHLIPKKLNFENFLRTIFFQGKVSRDVYVGIFHSMIFYGFIVLFIATELVGIHADTPFKVFKGTTYIVVSFLADIGGLFVLLGIGLAYYRRYVRRPQFLSATRPNQEKFMYGMLIALVVLGYVIEGIRIYVTNMPEGERFWSPIGYTLAAVIGSLGLTQQTLAFTYKSLWLIHMINTMAFVASFTHSKFFHVLVLPLSALLTPPRRGALLYPMDFANEAAETFGLGKTSELTMKQRLDTIACVECGRCTQVCPANLADKPLDPKLIITKMRDVMFYRPEATAENKEDTQLWGENPIYGSSELDACTTCGACMEECPANIEHVQIIMDLKRYKALTLGDLPPAAADATNKVKKNGNPWGISQDDRFNWAQGLEVPVIEAGKKVDYLYYVGCAGSYDASNQKVVKDTVNLLKKAGVSFAVMGKTEKCNGDPVRRFGDEYSFYEIAIENIANMRQYSFDKVVTHCPHCLHTIGKEYAKFEDGAFETVHHTELLSDLLRSGKLKALKEVAGDLTFHDPCYLGRHHGEYNAPRDILTSIPGVKLIEMEKNKDKALCCGMGGGNMWYELPEGKHLAENRLEHIGDTKAPKLATSCSYCMINFNSSKGTVKSTEDLQVEDVASILAKSVL